MSTYNSEGSEESESESAYWSTGIGRHLQCSLKVAKNPTSFGALAILHRPYNGATVYSPWKWYLSSARSRSCLCFNGVTIVTSWKRGQHKSSALTLFSLTSSRETVKRKLYKENIILMKRKSAGQPSADTKILRTSLAAGHSACSESPHPT